ncbi:hypothetical protein GGX14DRAFT_370029, partial [Mycena pura]
VSQCVGFAAFTILIWDHLDTFTTEVEYIWNGRKGFFVYLFLLVSLSGSCAPVSYRRTESLQVQYLFCYRNLRSTALPRCRHFIRYEGSMTVIGIHVVGIMMFIRYISRALCNPFHTSCFSVSAMYTTRWIVRAIVLAILIIMFSLNAWLLTRGQPVAHNPQSGVHACTMIFPPEFKIASASAWLPLLYDSVVLVLTLIRTLPLARDRNRAYIVTRLLEDGLIYYSAIFSVTLVLTMMIIFAPPGLKNIAAHNFFPIELRPNTLQVTMMSRITLNLRKTAHKRLLTTILRDTAPLAFNNGPST